MASDDRGISRRALLAATGAAAAGSLWAVSDRSQDSHQDSHVVDVVVSDPPLSAQLDGSLEWTIYALGSTPGEPIFVSITMWSGDDSEGFVSEPLYYYDTQEDWVREQTEVTVNIPADGYETVTDEFTPERPGEYLVGFKSELPAGNTVEVKNAK